MRALQSRRRWMMVVAIAAGITSTPAFADDGQAAAADSPAVPSVPVKPVPLEDPSASDQPAQEVPPPAAESSELPAPAAAVAETAPCACCNSFCCTKKKKEAATAKMKGAYKGLFYANDFSYLNDRCYDGPSFLGDGLKGLHCGNLDIGGEARVRFHSEDNHRGLGLTGLDDNFWLTRYRMYADLRLTQNVRLYGEYLYADSGGETFNNRPIEENRGEIQNLFVDLQLTDRLAVLLGRQELLYGAQRLISPLDWANTRRTFDVARFIYQGDTWNLDGFFSHPVNRNAANESKIDDTNEAVDFYGLYASSDQYAIGNIDVYYLGLNNGPLNFDYHTIGKRVSGTTDGGIMYDFENAFQFGENSNGSDHGAFFSTTGLGKQLSICTRCGEWNPTVWFFYDYASGEDDFAQVARGDDGFDHLFPLAHKYNGFMDLFGRRNLHDINAQFITPILGSKVKLLLWYHYFRLVEQTTPYSVVMTPFNTATAAGSKDLGHEIDVLFNVAINPRNSVLLGYSYFNAGDYYDTTAGVPTNQDAEFFYMQYQTRF